jgi:alkylation response protein AidB-like acyl-CoA dehydrogenase
MAAGTLLKFARRETLAPWLKGIFTAEEIWCQLFSEPGAGSDLAGVATTAIRDGNEWVVTGQKVWTSFAHEARWGLLLARTDVNVPKHQGLTYFVADLGAPGVEVRPLFEATGEAEFNEVFLDEVRIPDTRRLGEVGEGWTVARTTLLNERLYAGGANGMSGQATLELLREAWNATPIRSEVRRDTLIRLWAEARVLQFMSDRLSGSNGVTPGPEGSLLKLRWAELNKRASSFVLDLLGPAGMLYPDGYTFERPRETEVYTTSRYKGFLRARANSIEGGTTEIMRNIVAERVLGLPAEARQDASVPWREVPR